MIYFYSQSAYTYNMFSISKFTAPLTFLWWIDKFIGVVSAGKGSRRPSTYGMRKLSFFDNFIQTLAETDFIDTCLDTRLQFRCLKDKSIFKQQESLFFRFEIWFQNISVALSPTWSGKFGNIMLKLYLMLLGAIWHYLQWCFCSSYVMCTCTGGGGCRHAYVAKVGEYGNKSKSISTSSFNH